MEAIGNAAESRDQFLQLLVTQLRHQDPLEPTKQEDFLAQLAQFSTLEGVEKLNTNFETFFGDQAAQAAQLQHIQTMTNAAGLIGKQIEFAGEEGLESTGTVEAAVIEDDAVSVRVGDRLIPMEDIKQITSN